MSLSKSECWYSNSCLHFSKHSVPFTTAKPEKSAQFTKLQKKTVKVQLISEQKCYGILQS
jgi:hypothetical protein